MMEGRDGGLSPLCGSGSCESRDGSLASACASQSARHVVTMSLSITSTPETVANTREVLRNCMRYRSSSTATYTVDYAWNICTKYGILFYVTCATANCQGEEWRCIGSCTCTDGYLTTAPRLAVLQARDRGAR